MDRDEARRQVLDAIERGEIPEGGPSELAAHGLTEDVPAGYWERWSTRAVESIREQIRESDAANGGGRDGGQEVRRR